MSDTNTQTQEAQTTPTRINTQKIMARQIIFKLQKIKNKVQQKARREKKSIYRGTKIRITSNFSSDTMKEKSETIQSVERKKDHYLRIL